MRIEPKITKTIERKTLDLKASNMVPKAVTAMPVIRGHDGISFSGFIFY
jgi:hypothetical protein